MTIQAGELYKMNFLKNLKNYAEAHSQECWIEGDNLVVKTQWIDRQGNTGHDLEIAKTYQELRNILGY